MSEWISVNDRLPEKNQLVLIYAPDTDQLKIRIGLFDKEINIYHNLGITHWQPLPEPPK
jgi:hypothetical protein